MVTFIYFYNIVKCKKIAEYSIVIVELKMWFTFLLNYLINVIKTIKDDLTSKIIALRNTVWIIMLSIWG